MRVPPWAKRAEKAGAKSAKSLWRRTLDVLWGVIILWFLFRFLDWLLERESVQRARDSVQENISVEMPCSVCKKGQALVINTTRHCTYCDVEDLKEKFSSFFNGGDVDEPTDQEPMEVIELDERREQQRE